MQLVKASAAAPLAAARRARRPLATRCAAAPQGSGAGSADPLPRRTLVGGGVLGAGALLVGAAAAAAGGGGGGEGERQGEVYHTEEEWRQILSPEAYAVLRQAATERRGTSPLNKEKRPGTFKCAGCSTPLFLMSAKYDSGTGWPSFFQPVKGAVEEVPDYSVPWMPRTEVRCAKCKGHLGHVFNDGPRPTGMRYCMNGAALDFKPDA